MSALTALLFLGALAQAPSADALVVRADDVTIKFPEKGLALETLLQTWTNLTGRRFNYRDTDMRGKARVFVTGDVTVKKENVDTFFQSLLVTQGFALISLGPPEANLYAVEPIDSSRVLKQTATFVSREELQSIKGNRGQVVMTAIQLKHVEVSNVRGAIQQLLTNRQAEFAQEVAANNSLVLVGFAPTIASLERVLKLIDVPAPESMRDKQRNPHRGGK